MGDKDLIILVGMRNSGKSMYAHHLQTAHSFTQMCLDQIFEQEQSTTIKKFIEANGWQAFRQAETQLFIKTIFKGALNKFDLFSAL